MRNAKQELLSALGNDKEILCATLSYRGMWTNFDTPMKEYNLKKGHTFEEINEFFNLLDFEYDNGYGGQELFGIVWLTDGTWLSRYEYDGSECWEHNACPQIPEELL